MPNNPNPGPGGGHYSYGQLEGLWIAAGGKRSMAPLMAAIAMAESGGNAGARNPSGATGLWQILGAPAGWTGSRDFTDPFTNARAAVLKYRQQGLKAWVTWTSGAYRKYLRKGVRPVDPGGDTGQIGVPYRDPFRSVKGVTYARTDMGVDYAGTGPVYALGRGRVTGVSHAWAGGFGDVGPGTWITYRLDEGPARGQQIYLAEHVTPRVRVGQRVDAHTVIGEMAGGIETGFAAKGPAGVQGEALAAQLGEQNKSGDPGASPTAAGVAFGNLLAATGVRHPGTQHGGTGAHGTLPPWLAGILAGIDRGTGGTGAGGLGLGAGLGQVASAISGINDWLNGLAAAVDWLLNPANWVRIIAGIMGGTLTLGGVFVLSHVGGDVPGSQFVGGISARPAALPLGILMVGLGGMLLFVAFHNLPGQPASIGELLGDSQGAIFAARKELDILPANG